MDVFLGVDGGGTHTRALLVDRDGQILNRASTGSTNINQHSEKIVCERLNSLCAEALGGYESAYACFGLAGSASMKNSIRLNSILSQIPKLETRKTLLTTDAKIALHGAFNGGYGIVLIAGTGSICILSSAKNPFARFGGKGLPCGDPGSGYWIGYKALTTVLNQLDDALEETLLCNALCNHLSINSGASIRSKLESLRKQSTETATLAPIVCNLARNQESHSEAIVDEAVEHLYNLLQEAVEQFKEASIPVVLAGGVLSKETIIRERLTKRIQKQLPNVQLKEPLLTATQGALLLAQKLATEE